MKKILPLIPLFFLLIIGCKKEEGTVIARVGKSTLTLEKLNSVIPFEYRTMVSSEDKKKFAENWINTELVYQKAIREGTLKEPEVAEQIEQLKRQVVINNWLSRYAYDKIYVGEEDLRNNYDTNRDKYYNEIKVAHIVLPTEADALEVEKRLNDGEDFEKLARERSIDPSGKKGGVLGYIKLGDTALPEFEAAAFSLKKVGEISDIVQTSQGFHIIKLLGRRKIKNPPTFEDIKENIRKKLLLQKQTALIDSLIQQLREEIPIETHYELIK